MKNLSEALLTMLDTSPEAGERLLTPQLGSTSEGGRLITRPLSNPNISYGPGTPHWAINETPPRAPVTRASESSPNAEPDGRQRTPLKHDRHGQEELTRLLYQTFASQKAYGNRAGMMEYRDGMFQLVLGEYTIEQVREAFIEHVRRKPDLPTPSDIVNLIDPPPPVLSAAYYTSLRKRVSEGEYLLSDERAFCRAFERQELAKTAGR